MPACVCGCRRVQLLHSVPPEDAGRVRPCHPPQVSRSVGPLFRPGRLRRQNSQIRAVARADHSDVTPGN